MWSLRGHPNGLFCQDSQGFFEMTNDFIRTFCLPSFNEVDFLNTINHYRFFRVSANKMRAVWDSSLPVGAFERIIFALVRDLAFTYVRSGQTYADSNVAWWGIGNDLSISISRLAETFVFLGIDNYLLGKICGLNRHAFVVIRIVDDAVIGIDIEHHREEVREWYKTRCYQLMDIN